MFNNINIYDLADDLDNILKTTYNKFKISNVLQQSNKDCYMLIVTGYPDIRKTNNVIYKTLNFFKEQENSYIKNQDECIKPTIESVKKNSYLAHNKDVDINHDSSLVVGKIVQMECSNFDNEMLYILNIYKDSESTKKILNELFGYRYGIQNSTMPNFDTFKGLNTEETKFLTEHSKNAFDNINPSLDKALSSIIRNIYKNSIKFSNTYTYELILSNKYDKDGKELYYADNFVPGNITVTSSPRYQECVILSIENGEYKLFFFFFIIFN